METHDMAGVPKYERDGDTAPSLDHIRRGGDRLKTLGLRAPCHVLVRPSCVRGGAVLDVVAPMDPETTRAAREHYDRGGLVRLNARFIAELMAARVELCQPAAAPQSGTQPGHSLLA
jgi:hypothetical protein